MDSKTKNRCILIFPEIDNIHIINEIREKYDPAVKHIRPHITLVFPFESNIGKSDLRKHLIHALSGIKPFKITLEGITGVTTTSHYLFLNIGNGKNEIIDIHKKLYTGILEGFIPEWHETSAFLPHMTVGKMDTAQALQEALEDTKSITEIFQATIRKISVEIIAENEDSIIEMEIMLS